MRIAAFLALPLLMGFPLDAPAQDAADLARARIQRFMAADCRFQGEGSDPPLVVTVSSDGEAVIQPALYQLQSERRIPGVRVLEWTAAARPDLTTIRGTSEALARPSWPLSLVLAFFDSETGERNRSWCYDCFSPDQLCRTTVAGRSAWLVTGRSDGWLTYSGAVLMVEITPDDWLALQARVRAGDSSSAARLLSTLQLDII